MWVPLKEKEKKNKHKNHMEKDGWESAGAVKRIVFFVFIIFSSFSDSRVSNRQN